MGCCSSERQQQQRGGQHPILHWQQQPRLGNRRGSHRGRSLLPGNQIFNPCRGGGGNRNSGNSGNTNNRFLGNNGATNGLLGIIGGFIAGQVANNVQGNPCG